MSFQVKLPYGLSVGYTLLKDISLLDEDPIEEVLFLLKHVADIGEEWVFAVAEGVTIDGRDALTTNRS